MDENFIVLMDFFGTAIFALTGAIKGIERRLDIFGVTVLGCTVGIGGGVIRDLLVCTIPSVLRYDFYATAALIGGGLFLFLHHCGMSRIPLFWSVAAIVFLLWIIAFFRYLRLPRRHKSLFQVVRQI